MSARHAFSAAPAAICLMLMGGTSTLEAQDPLTIPLVSDPITLDGRFQEPAWERAATLPLVGYKPVSGAAPSESTVVRVLHDGRALYVAAEMFDRDPAGVQDRSRSRDEDYGGDFVNILLDTFSDHENAVVFTTTPAGARLDFAVMNDGEGANPATISWNGFWDVKVRRDEHGWFAEFRIPFSTLRYQPVGDQVRMGLIVNRLIGRKSERVIFPAVEPRWAFGMFKPSQSHPILMNGVSHFRQRIISPYLLGGRERAAELDAPARKYGMGSETRHEAGGDLKLAVADNINLDLTINTDFAETEVDDQLINLGRFPILFPERRQFFIERAGVFDLAMTGSNTLLHTRRIGLTDDGLPVPIYGGARLIGRSGALDYGLLDMQTQEGEGQPSTNFGVLRVRKRIFNTESYVGSLLTTRLSTREDLALGGDATLRLAGSNFLRLTAAASDGSAGPGVNGSLWDRAAWSAQFERRSTIGLGGQAVYLRLGNAFSPPIGFIESQGLERTEVRVDYGFLASPEGKVRIVTPSLRALRTYDLTAGAVQTTLEAAQTTVEMKSGASLAVRVERRHEVIRDSLPVTDQVVIPPGGYDFGDAIVSIGTAPDGTAALQAQAVVGGHYGGRRVSGNLKATWHPVAALTITGDYIHERLHITGYSPVSLQVARLRAALAANGRLSAATTIQHSTAAHLTSLNLRLRYNFREGTDLWLVYDQVLNSDRDRQLPELATTQRESVLVKFTYALSN